jgi:hypothetical protein
MKSSSIINYFACVGLFSLASVFVINLRADDFNNVPSQPSQLGTVETTSQTGEQAQPQQVQVYQQPASQQQQQTFASADEAVKALRVAVEANDRAALAQIFGPDFHSLQTGDKVQDANNARHFAYAMAQSCHLENGDNGEMFVDVGTNDWPMPIPLRQNNGQWYFDTAAGQEEIIDRHIGRDELTAIGVCRAYVNAQKEYASMNGGHYALKFKSSDGMKDGLYWPAAPGEPASPFGALVAEAHAEGYGGHHGNGPHAFHGYYFRILTRQGHDAPGGKMDYLTSGHLTGGFALVAYPENWNKSGVMTFIIGDDGKVYQRDYGVKTDHIAAKLKEYNPDKYWTLVQDEGILDAASSE